MTQNQNCGKCGVCLSVCPVYNILKQEQISPRAKVQLIKHFDEGDLSSTPYLKEIVSQCLMCGSCAVNCPAGIDHYDKFMAMRSKMVRDHGQRVEIKSLIYLLAKEYRTRMGVGAARLGRRLLPEAFMKKYTLGRLGLKNLPRFNQHPFRSVIQESVAPDGRERGTVLYFTGCGTNYLFDETGHSTVSVLKHMGYRVLIPRGQTCCAIPMLFHGAEEQALGNIRQNIAALDRDDIEAIIVDCATCGTALKNEYPALLRNDKSSAAAVKGIAGKVAHLLPFIAQHRDLLFFNEFHGEKTKVTYHTPCHLTNHFTTLANIEELLRSLPHVAYTAAVDADQCCGGGGTFFYEYPDISQQIVEQKIKNAMTTEAQLLMTDCPVCRIQLAGRLTEENPIRVVHPISVIASGLNSKS